MDQITPWRDELKRRQLLDVELLLVEQEIVRRLDDRVTITFDFPADLQSAAAALGALAELQVFTARLLTPFVGLENLLTACLALDALQDRRFADVVRLTGSDAANGEIDDALRIVYAEWSDVREAVPQDLDEIARLKLETDGDRPDHRLQTISDLTDRIDFDIDFDRYSKARRRRHRLVRSLEDLLNDIDIYPLLGDLELVGVRQGSVVADTEKTAASLLQVVLDILLLPVTYKDRVLGHRSRAREELMRERTDLLAMRADDLVLAQNLLSINATKLEDLAHAGLKRSTRRRLTSQVASRATWIAEVVDSVEASPRRGEIDTRETDAPPALPPGRSERDGDS